MKEFLLQPWMGMPVWGWALLVAIGLVNEVVQRAKWTAAQSALQGAAAFMLAIPILGTVILAKFPVVGWLLERLAAKPKDNPEVLK